MCGEIQQVSSILDGSSLRTRVVSRETEKADGAKMESVIGGGPARRSRGFKTLNEIAELVDGLLAQVAQPVIWTVPTLIPDWVDGRASRLNLYCGWNFRC